MSNTYKASKLPSGGATAMSKSDSLPVLKIHGHTENITIPSVRLERRGSKRSERSLDDSKSLDSFGSSSAQPSRVVSKLKGGSHAFMHPVQVVNRREIRVDLSPPKEAPHSKLDLLEAYLPKTLRKDHSSAKHRLRIPENGEQRTLFNILHGEHDDQRSTSASINSYTPIHFASGDWSAAGSKVSTAASASNDEGDKLVRSSSGIALNPFFQKNVIPQHKSSLWESTATNGMLMRELLKEQAEQAERLIRSQEVQQAVDTQKETLTQNTILKVKVLNTIFANKIKLKDAIETAAKQLQPITNVRKKKGGGVSDYAIQNETLQLDFRDPTRKPEEELDYEQIEHAEKAPFLQRLLTVKNMRGEDEEPHYVRDKQGKRLSMESIDDDESLSSDVIRNLQDLAASDIKAKLNDLAKYINSHTSRKILDTWHLIEGRFKSSTHSKSVIEIDANGLAHPVKQPAIPISALACMLCSTKIKVGHEELSKMCNKLGFISPEQVFQARRVAAMQVILAMNDEIKSEHFDTFKQELWHLMKGGEPLVSLQEFIDIIFAEDPEERETQFAAIRANRQEQVQAMIDEKKNKATMKQRAAARKKQMIDDFTVALATLQIMKGVLTPGRVDEFTEMVEKCKRYIEKQKEDQAANVPQDLVLFLGLEAYPQIIQDKINAKREAYRLRHRPSDSTVSTANSALNPFSKANLAKKSVGGGDDDASIGSAHSLTSIAEHPHGLEGGSSLISAGIATQASSNTAGRSAAGLSAGSHSLPKKVTIGSSADASDVAADLSLAGLSVAAAPVAKARIPAYKRVLLAGPPPVLDVIREMVSYGRGLQGISYRDAVAVLQAVSATKIASAFRCFSRRWRYSAARRMWIKRFLRTCSVHFAAMKVLVKHNVNTRNYCWRKIKAWKYYTKRAHERRTTFRIAFWPFYVWHRYADAAGKAKDKAKFLTGRVIPALWTIKVFKAWKAYSKLEAHLNRIADAYNRKLTKADSIVLFRWLAEWSHKRHAIRHAWVVKGNEMHMRYASRLVLLPFYIWRTYTNYRKITRGRAKMQHQAMRHIVMKGKPPKRTKSNAEKRIAMKVAELQRRLKGRRVTQGELKDKLKKRAKAKKESSASAVGRRSNAPGSPSFRESGTSDEDSISASRTSSRKSATRTGSAVVEVPLDFHDATIALFKPNFKWALYDTEIYDVDIDQEDEEGLTPLLLNSYKAAVTKAMNSPDTFDFYKSMSHSIADQSANVREFYSFADHWNTFEAAVRFHFYGYRVFNNLRHNATMRRKVKEYMAMRVRRIKMQIIIELRKSVEIRTKRNVTVRGSEAERISHSVRAHQLAKIVRTRKFTSEVNNALGRDFDDEVDDETARLNRIRQLNLIDPDDEQYMAKEAKRLEERQAELRRQKIERDKKFQPPNLLELDRGDRNLEEDQAAKMVEFSRATRAVTGELVVTSDNITAAFRDKMDKLDDMVHEVLDTESGTTSRAIDKQEAYMAQFKVHAANALISALLKVYLEVQMSLMKEESKVYFRCLRLPMLLSRSKSMYFRKRLINWIRICKRLISISRRAPYYQTTRTKWIIFNRWLKFIEIEKLNPTPGLVNILRRKAKLIPDFDRALQNDNFQKSVYLDNQRLNHATSEFKNVFSRWKLLTQEDVLFRVLNDRAKLLFKLRIMQKCFWALKTGLDIAEYMPLIREDQAIFPITRALADIDQVVKRFIVGRRKSLATVVRRNNRKYVKFVIKDGRDSLSFKSFMTQFKADSNSRISTEQRMISDYFELRGTQTFDDIHAPEKNHPIVPPIMARVTGREFADPHQITADGRSIAIPGGYKLSKVKFAFQYGLGIIGWQLFWNADGAKELESPQRGAWHSASLSVHEFAIPKDDFLIGVEYMYDSDVIVGIRLKMFFAGFTKWAGGKTSLSTLSVFLDVNLAPREDYEDERDGTLHPDQLKDPAMPYNFIIGFTGVVTSGRTTGLGLVVRKVTVQNLFSYTWVGDALWKLELERSEKAAEATLPSIDMYSMPSHLSNFVNAGAVGPPAIDAGDSLTMSAQPSSVEELKEMDASSVGSLESESQSSFQGSSPIADDDDSVGSASNSQSPSKDNEPVKPRARRLAISNPVIAKMVARPTATSKADPLSSSEIQFFDVLRMRTTELSHALSRSVDFARNLWTDKTLRLDAQLSKLVTIRVVRGLTMWLFNALSKRLMSLSVTEKGAMKLLRNSKVLVSKADSVRNRVNQILMNADVLESSAQPWTGKHLLSPKERALRAEFHQRVAAMRAEAAKVKRGENMLRLQAVIDEKRGLAMMPKLTLSVYIVSNYRLKLAAARHKESLLERMTLDEVKTGLFGSNLKEKLLSKEQMQAIHESLRSQQLKLKDVTSLERLIDDVVEEEGDIAEKEEKKSIALPRKSTRRASSLAVAPSTHKAVRIPGTISEQSSATLNMGSRLSDNLALKLNTSNLVNRRTRSPPMPMTDRISAPSTPLPPKSREGGGGRSYSIMEFNPLVLPESPPSGIAARKVVSPPSRRNSPNRSRNTAASISTAAPRTNSAPRANSISVSSSLDRNKGAKTQPVRQVDRRKFSAFTSFGDDDDST